jgi:hypothetical protein
MGTELRPTNAEVLNTDFRITPHWGKYAEKIPIFDG